MNLDPFRTLWIIGIVLLGLDTLFVALRSSVNHVRLPQLISLVNQQEKKLDRVLRLVEKLGLRAGLRLLVATSHILLGLVTYLLLEMYLPGLTLGVGLALLVVFALFLLAFEFLVEGRVLRNPEIWMIRLAPLAVGLDFIMRPFSSLLLALLGSTVSLERQPGSVTEDELKNWVEVGESTGGLEKGERQMIYSIFHFGDTLCREIMIPRIDILALEVNTTVNEAILALSHSGHSRVPVYEETIDNVVGLLYAKDLLRSQIDGDQPDSVRPYLRPAYFVPEAKKVDELLREMQARSVHMAVVVDEYGGMAGLVTLEDIVEEIVGEIRDEYDQAEELLYQQVSVDEVIFHGRVDLDDVNEVLGTHLTNEMADTLGGYIYGTIGRVPVGGEEVAIDDWTLTVEQVSGRRIRKVRARRNPRVLEVEEAQDDTKH